ncbi:MAG: hypothetical protein ACKOET_08310, partial [Verrucomicrobiota bacterium]
MVDPLEQVAGDQFPPPGPGIGYQRPIHLVVRLGLLDRPDPLHAEGRDAEDGLVCGPLSRFPAVGRDVAAPQI